ncbi:MAG TPA: phosphomannomutase [Firmicutes bacterium]|jgi:phosphomannomutase/phosphoglucomutase|nr:phosphomannomutase [Bacillota bacterium]
MTSQREGNHGINPEIFREYDIRGLADVELTPELVWRLGLACGRYFQDNNCSQVLVGRDNRLSSDRIFRDLALGLMEAGCTLTDLGVVTTPHFYFSRVHLGIDAGVMITASHNGKEFNGFKIALGPGTIYGQEIQKLLHLCREQTRERPGRGDLPPFARIDPRTDYLNMIADKIRLGPRRLKVAIDCGNGTTALFAQELFTRLGCDLLPLYCESDGSFPHHHPDPVEPENLRALIDLVRKEKADLGISFDGDGDRLGVVDENGQIVWGDRYMALFWREILAKHPGADCLIEVKCSQALVEEVTRLGGKPQFCRTGHSLVKAKMRELGALFAGEMSGHMFFADEYYGFDDAFYAAGRLLRILSHTEKSLSKLLSDLPVYPATTETRVACADGDKFRIVQEVAADFRRNHQVIDIDGARVLFPGGWGLIRASNTQPAIVARCEGKTEADLKLICSQLREALLRFSEVSPFEWVFVD